MTSNNNLQLVLSSADLVLLDELSRAPLPGVVVGEPVRLPGFGQTFGELLVSWGINTVPAGVVSGLIANWLFQVWRGRKPSQTRATIVYEGQELDVELTGPDAESLAADLRAAIERAAQR